MDNLGLVWNVIILYYCQFGESLYFQKLSSWSIVHCNSKPKSYLKETFQNGHQNRFLKIFFCYFDPFGKLLR